MSYPVSFTVEYEQPRKRLTAFFRLLLAIPAFIWVMLYGIAAGLAVIGAWFAIVITGRYPPAMYKFVAGWLTVATQVTCYSLLLCDPYPPFTPDNTAYPVQMGFEGPLPRYSRLLTFFRIILAIPLLLIRYVLSGLLEIAAFFAWFVIVITGRLPRGLYEMMVLGASYVARSDAYLMLLTENYPPFQDETTRTAGLA